MKRWLRRNPPRVVLRVEPDGMAVRFAMVVFGVEISSSVPPDDARVFAAGLLFAANAADRTAAEAIL